MIRAAIPALAALLSVVPAVAQTPPAAEIAPQGALLRGLDRMAGSSADVSLAPGASATFGPLTITLHECRYPAGEPLADAFAHLTVSGSDGGPTLFSGWMIASSPALSALDHPRYDVWVLRCNTPAAESGDG